MSSYDRSAQRQGKKGKKGKKDGSGQQPARKRKHYSDMIPFRNLARMLKSNGPERVGLEANLLKKDPVQGDNGLMADRLAEMARNGLHGEYGERVQGRAKEALKFVK